MNFVNENVFENVACKMFTIVSEGQGVYLTYLHGLNPCQPQALYYPVAIQCRIAVVRCLNWLVPSAVWNWNDNKIVNIQITISQQFES